MYSYLPTLIITAQPEHRHLHEQSSQVRFVMPEIQLSRAWGSCL